jgi:hypothetical protein
MSIDSFSIFFFNYKKQHPSFDQIQSPKSQDEDSYFRLNGNNSDDNLSLLSPINSNRRNEEFNPDLFSRQNIRENFPLQNILNEDRTMAGTTQILDNPENNNYSLFRNPIYIQSQQPNDDLDNNYNGNRLIGTSFLRDEVRYNNTNSIFNQNCPPIQNIGNAPYELRTRPTATQIPTNPKNNNNLLNISLSSIKSSQSINNSDDNFNENILDNNSSSSYHTNSNNRNINVNQNNFPSQNIGYFPNEPRTSTIATQMLDNPESRAGTNYHLFEVKKVLNKKRKRDNIDSDNAKVHDKYETKNIMTKIKKAVYNNDIKFTNKSIEDSTDEEIKKRKIILKKVENSKIEVSSREDNLRLLETEMKDILSYPLSNNFKTVEKDYNKKAIDFILTRKDEKLNSILKKNFEDVIRIYAGDLIDKDFDGFKKLEDDIKEMEDKGEDEKYIEKYREHAKNYKKIYMKMRGRTPRMKK